MTALIEHVDSPAAAASRARQGRLRAVPDRAGTASPSSWRPGDLPWVLVSWRAEQGLSQRALARRLGCSPGAVEHWERGRVPGPAHLGRLASLLNAPVADLRRAAGPDRVRRAETSGGSGTTALARARIAVGLSQAELARRLAVSASSLSRWECAERRPPATLVPALSRHLELSRAEAIALFDDYPDSGRDTVGRLRGLGAALDRASVDRGAIAHVCCVSVSRVDAWATGRIAVPASAVQPLSRLLGIDVLHHLADLRHPVPTPPRPLGELRRSCRLTQAGLAAALGVSGSTVGTWERGERVPRPHQVRTLARILRLHPAALVAATGWELPGPVDLDQAGRHGIPGTLVALRLAEGLSLAQVARSVGVTAGTVRRWEKGRTRPSSARITRLAAVYRVDADVLHRLARSTPSQGVITEGNLPWTSR